MKVRKIVVAPFLAVALVASTAACGSANSLRACTEYEDEVLDLDDEGECYAPNDDKKHGSTKSGSKSGTKKHGAGTKSSSTKSGTKSSSAKTTPTRKK